MPTTPDLPNLTNYPHVSYEEPVGQLPDLTDYSGVRPKPEEPVNLPSLTDYNTTDISQANIERPIYYYNPDDLEVVDEHDLRATEQAVSLAIDQNKSPEKIRDIIIAKLGKKVVELADASDGIVVVKLKLVRGGEKIVPIVLNPKDFGTQMLGDVKVLPDTNDDEPSVSIQEVRDLLEELRKSFTEGLSNLPDISRRIEPVLLKIEQFAKYINQNNLSNDDKLGVAERTTSDIRQLGGVFNELDYICNAQRLTVLNNIVGGGNISKPLKSDLDSGAEQNYDVYGKLLSLSNDLKSLLDRAGNDVSNARIIHGRMITLLDNKLDIKRHPEQVASKLLTLLRELRDYFVEADASLKQLPIRLMYLHNNLKR